MLTVNAVGERLEGNLTSRSTGGWRRRTAMSACMNTGEARALVSLGSQASRPPSVARLRSTLHLTHGSQRRREETGQSGSSPCGYGLSPPTRPTSRGAAGKPEMADRGALSDPNRSEALTTGAPKAKGATAKGQRPIHGAPSWRLAPPRRRRSSARIARTLMHWVRGHPSIRFCRFRRRSSNPALAQCGRQRGSPIARRGPMRATPPVR